jgi:hypothetical protein
VVIDRDDYSEMPMPPLINPYESPRHTGESQWIGERWFCGVVGFLAGMLFVCAGQLLAGFIVTLLQMNW